MNKTELDNLTKHESTWEEFAAIERLYMTAPNMTKEDAARTWRRFFLGAAIKREAAHAEPANRRELLDALQADIRRHPLGRVRRVQVRGNLYRFTDTSSRGETVYHCEAVLAVDIARGTTTVRDVGNFWPVQDACAVYDDIPEAAAV